MFWLDTNIVIFALNRRKPEIADRLSAGSAPNAPRACIDGPIAPTSGAPSGAPHIACRISY
jgi:hypothetical protein